LFPNLFRTPQRIERRSSLWLAEPESTLAHLGASIRTPPASSRPSVSVVAGIRYNLIGYQASLQELNAIAKPRTTVWLLREAHYGASEGAWCRLVARQRRDAVPVTSLVRWRTGIYKTGCRHDDRDRC
jgi:hypothetical protein